MEPRYIWSDATGEGRSRVTLFRRRFSLAGTPTAGTLHLFADTRYRLAVNGIVVGHGPARFHKSHPEYDTWDIGPWLRTGENVVAVTVHSIGRQTFSSDRSVGGLIAWGDVASDGGVTALTSGPDWRALAADAYRDDTQRLTFALGPYEWLDARQLPDGRESPAFDDDAWPAAVPIADAGRWGALRPRSIPLLDEREVLPRRLSGAFTAHGDGPGHRICSLRYVCRDADYNLQRAPLALFTYLYSPREQTIPLGVSWGRFFHNGIEVKPQPRGDRQWRGDCAVSLTEGWNSWLVLDTLTGDAYEYALQWPEAAGIVVSAERRMDGAPTFFVYAPLEGALSDLVAAAGSIAHHEKLSEIGGEGALHPAEWGYPSPFAARAWERLEPLGVGKTVRDAWQRSADGVVLLYDFGTEVLGRPRLEMTAKAGTTVDLLYTERTENGAALHGVQATRTAERYVARDGWQTWQTLHPRGMRYLEVVVRGDDAGFELHRVGLTRANYPVRDIGRFACSDPLLERIWQVGRDTLFACMEDAYLDCPWRERGLYTGDLLVQYDVNRATFGDHALMRRCIAQILETQSAENGLLSCCSHGLPSGRHPDYSAIAIQALAHYWACTGDTDFVREQETRLRALLRGLRSLEPAGLDLIDGTGLHPYIDLSRMDRDGVSCALNAFHQRAFSAGADLLRLLGDEADAGEAARHANAVASAIRKEFWDAERGAFLDRRRADRADTAPSALGNALPLLYGIATPEQAEAALRFVLQAMAENRIAPEPRRSTDFHLSSYSSYYALGTLHRYGHGEAAQRFVRENWGPMLDAGAVTWWEYFLEQSSLCHAWSAAPTHYLSTRALGVRCDHPGEPDRVTIRPRPGTLRWASGIYPHRRGPLRVEWELRGDRLLLDYDAPEGVEVAAESQTVRGR